MLGYLGVPAKGTGYWHSNPYPYPPVPLPMTLQGYLIPLQYSNANASDQQKVVAVLLHLEDPCADHFVQVHLDECMMANMWPTWAALQAEIEGFFLPGNNKEWARSQLLLLCQGPRQRINDFLAQFQALKLQSECPDKYAKDLLERAVTRKILEQVYMQGRDRTTWVCVTQAVRTVGRA